MKIYVDIDNTICKTIDGQYKESTPYTDRIEKINKLYEEGNTIIFHTARGMGRTSNNSLMAHRLFFYLIRCGKEKPVLERL